VRHVLLQREAQRQRHQQMPTTQQHHSQTSPLQLLSLRQDLPGSGPRLLTLMMGRSQRQRQ